MSATPLDWKLVPVPEVTVAAVGDELVALAPDGRCHAVANPGALLWPLLDGQASVRELAADVADVFGVDEATATNDVAAFARSMAALGLVADVDGRHGRPSALGHAERGMASHELLPRWVQMLEVPGEDPPAIVACDDADLAGVLERVLGGTPIDHPDREIAFGLSVARRPGAGPRLIPEVFDGTVSLLRSRRLGRLVRVLESRLTGRPANGTVGVPWATAVVRSGRAALVPREVLDRWSVGEQLVADAGGGIVDDPSVVVGTDGGAVVAATRSAGADEIQDELAVDPGRYPLVAVFWNEVHVGEDERPTTGVGRFVELADTKDRDERRELLGVAPVLAPTFHHDPVHRDVADVQRVLAALD